MKAPGKGLFLAVTVKPPKPLLIRLPITGYAHRNGVRKTEAADEHRWTEEEEVRMVIQKSDSSSFPKYVIRIDRDRIFDIVVPPYTMA